MHKSNLSRKHIVGRTKKLYIIRKREFSTDIFDRDLYNQKLGSEQEGE